jgi:hypothetical protein
MSPLLFGDPHEQEIDIMCGMGSVDRFPPGAFLTKTGPQIGLNGSFIVRRDLQLETRVTAARFEEGSNSWTVTKDRGEHVSARGQGNDAPRSET